MKLLWPDEVKHDQVLLFLTDAERYMIKADKGFKKSFFECGALDLSSICVTLNVRSCAYRIFKD